MIELYKDHRVKLIYILQELIILFNKIIMAIYNMVKIFLQIVQVQYNLQMKEFAKLNLIISANKRVSLSKYSKII